jgi:hypothetical protein
MYFQDVNTAIGYHTISKFDKADKIPIVMANISNFLSYLPVIGTIIGIVRISLFAAIYLNSDLDSTQKMLAFAHIIRGAIEVTSFGSILIIPDLIFTIGRIIKESNHNTVINAKVHKHASSS